MSASFAEVFRAAVRESGRTLSSLAQAVGEHGHTVDVSTLSTWQSGRRTPGRHSTLDILQTLELVLELDPDTLVRAAGFPVGAAPSSSAPWPWAEMLQQRRRDWGLPPGGYPTDLFLDRWTLVPDGQVAELTLLRLVRAPRPGRMRLTLVVPGAPGDVGAPARAIGGRVMEVAALDGQTSVALVESFLTAEREDLERFELTFRLPVPEGELRAPVVVPSLTAGLLLERPGAPGSAVLVEDAADRWLRLPLGDAEMRDG